MRESATALTISRLNKWESICSTKLRFSVPFSGLYYTAIVRETWKKQCGIQVITNVASVNNVVTNAFVFLFSIWSVEADELPGRLLSCLIFTNIRQYIYVIIAKQINATQYIT